MQSTPTPTEKPIRLTITVTPEVHTVFTRLAKASGMSLGRTMGEWLGDTIEAVSFTAEKVEQARAAPKMVMREMHAYALGLADETGELMRSLSAKGAALRQPQGVAAPVGAQHPAPPRPVIRGGKSPKTGKTSSGKAR